MAKVLDEREERPGTTEQVNISEGPALQEIPTFQGNPLEAALREHADLRPDLDAVIYPLGKSSRYGHMTYRELNQDADRCAFGLQKLGIVRGTRVVFMVKPGRECMVILFAMFKIGAVPVLVDPGMGVDRMLHCLKDSEAKALIGIPIAHVLRTIRPGFFKSIKIAVTVGRKLFWDGAEYQSLLQRPWEPFPVPKLRGEDVGAIAFTTGSTGPAKGVEYSIDMVGAQMQSIRQGFGFVPGQISMPTFPLFSIFCIALGMTTVIPDMDPTLPAKVDPEKIIGAVNKYRVSSVFASPALLERVGKYGKLHNVKLPTLKTVMAGGAPVRPSIIQDFVELLEDDGQVYAAYGATEAIPISMISGRDVLSETKTMTDRGSGTCVGFPLPGLTVKVIPIKNQPIAKFSSEHFLSAGSIGELIVKGRVVSRRYFRRPKDDLQAKIRDGKKIWHRTGDLGWIDDQGRIWMCGRMKHRVQANGSDLYTVQIESIFNTHPAVKRSALVGVGPVPQIPVICIELKRSQSGRARKSVIRKELLQLAKQHEITSAIEKVMFHKEFPVDIRHNAKIFREELAIWAEQKLVR